MNTNERVLVGITLMVVSTVLTVGNFRGGTWVGYALAALIGLIGLWLIMRGPQRPPASQASTPRQHSVPEQSKFQAQVKSRSRPEPIQNIEPVKPFNTPADDQFLTMALILNATQTDARPSPPPSPMEAWQQSIEPQHDDGDVQSQGGFGTPGGDVNSQPPSFEPPAPEPAAYDPTDFVSGDIDYSQP